MRPLLCLLLAGYVVAVNPQIGAAVSGQDATSGPNHVSGFPGLGEMTPARIAQAITLGDSKEKLDNDLVVRVGSPRAPRLEEFGAFSTPFLRVALSARLAKRESRPFLPGDVTPEMLAREFHIYTRPLTSGAFSADASTIVVLPVKGSAEEKLRQAVKPLRFEALPTEFRNLLGPSFKGTGRLAVFPLSIVSRQSEIHVVYPAREGGYDDFTVRFDELKIR